MVLAADPPHRMDSEQLVGTRTVRRGKPLRLRRALIRGAGFGDTRSPDFDPITVRQPDLPSCRIVEDDLANRRIPRRLAAAPDQGDLAVDFLDQEDHAERADPKRACTAARLQHDAGVIVRDRERLQWANLTSRESSGNGQQPDIPVQGVAHVAEPSSVADSTSISVHRPRQPAAADQPDKS